MTWKREAKTSNHREKQSVRRIGVYSTTDDFFFHPFFNGNLCQRSAIIALVTANPPFFDPFFLHIRLPTLRTHKYAFHVVHFPRLFHASLSVFADQDGIGNRVIARRSQLATSGLTHLQWADRMPPCNEADHSRFSLSSSSHSPAVPKLGLILLCQD